MPIRRAPRALPSLSTMLDDLGRPPAARVAACLGVHERTVRTWLARDEAPRAAMLALYWLTTWGQQQVHAQATNDARVWEDYARALAADVAALRRELARVVACGRFDAANDPTVPDLARARPVTAPGAVVPLPEPRRRAR